MIIEMLNKYLEMLSAEDTAVDTEEDTAADTEVDTVAATEVETTVGDPTTVISWRS